MAFSGLLYYYRAYKRYYNDYHRGFLESPGPVFKGSP